ncbi:MAG TPA: UDP-N-acetylmuramate dehydrogenase [Acidimicrobiales bacterium]|nr:UDP-N-acetylmuramate dehydrogenase [Acidimicrobiales bacterium]
MTGRADDLRLVGSALGSLARWDHPLGALTTYRVGGPAHLFVEVADETELAAVAAAVAGRDVAVLVLGKGSNILVADGGFAGLAVSLAGGFDEIVIEGSSVRAGGAVSFPVLARRSASAGLTGLEWAVGVPGSVGGAIRMNAGGHGSDTARVLAGCRLVDLRSGVTTDVPVSDLAYAYRHSSISRSEVVVSGTFGLQAGDPERALAEIAEIVRWRREHQPGGSNAGSVFTNPPDDSAGRLIDEAGLKGHRIGSAEVSSKHANFIQADGGGSAADVRRLIEDVQRRVRDRFGVELATEVKMIGFGAAAGPGSRS